ncbi:hypothetical protein EDC04DRAFT_2630934 [Pisolithus marmoratus]|nr:hypothetical protein EDC04DRAFT_2630934 [Pisolithus marmoratus]
MEEFYIPTTTSRSRSPEHHVPTNSHHDRRGRSPPERSFTTVTRVFDAIRERTARSLLSLSHPGFSSSRSMFTDRSERGGLPSTSQESSRILAGTNTSQVATDSLSCAATPGSGPEFTETFQRGVYNYPFHFNLPSNVPPTTKTEHGSFTWRLNASVKQNSSRSLSTLFIAACKEVEVVYSPSDDELGEISQTSDDMQWEGILDTDFEYRFTIPRNSNPLGEIFPVLFESQSLRRIRTFRIAVHVYLNEYLEYFSRSGVSVRTETSRTMITQFEHFSNTPPDVQTFGTSPWGIRTIPRLPDAMQGFHASTPKVNSEGGMQRNPKSNVGIHHSMEVHIRVEKGDDGAATGRDFFIHVPMRMLSNFCTGEWAALPRYPNSSLPSMESNSRSSHNRSTDRSTGRLSDFLNQQSNPGRESRVSLPFLPRSLWARTKPHRRVDGFSSCRELYERLVSGLESETGQCPPRYGKRKLQRRM